ncbi:MAG: hypothetical protein EZS28_015144 [Streblomastix strix]|uniref:Uncharacterized protein n=1 Tax=Streblomastix strix TaxID=222440 RepID=A0A5J4W3B8_9EUKA|nr:MAG: hypothetical protein EZS28_015144 [Streblomastix strix]
MKADNDLKGPSKFSTTYKTFHNVKPLERALQLHPINEYESDVQIDVGPLELTGFTHNIIQLYEHRAVPKEMVAVEPSSEFVEHLKKLPIVYMRRNKETNPLVDDSAYYEKYPNQEKNFNSKPPTIMKISYQNLPYFDGSEVVPRQVFMDKSGYSVNNMPAIGRPLGSGAYEFDNGLGHEVEGVTQQQVKLIRDKRPMEYEQLHLGRKIRSVYQTMYIDPLSPHQPGSILRQSIMARRLDEYDGNRDITLQSPASTRVFQLSIIDGRQIPSKGKGVELLSGDTRLLTISERENIIGVMRDKHHGFSQGRSVTNNFKEETGHSHNKGLVSKRLEYEGDVPNTINKSDYISPDAQRTQRREYLANTAIGRDLDMNIDATCQRLASKAGAIKLYAQKEDHLPRQVFISPSGFTRAVNQLKLIVQ